MRKFLIKMRKFTLLLSLLLFVIVVSQAQDYQISFEGIGASNTVGTVTVENLTQKKSITLSGAEILHLKSIVTANNPSLEYTDFPINIYPNPSNGYCTIEFGSRKSGPAIIKVFDPIGREIVMFQQNLSEGIHSFKISGLSNGIYIVNVSLYDQSYSDKIVSNSKYHSRADIAYIGNSGKLQEVAKLKNATSERFWQYNTGDRLKFIGTSGKYSTIVVDIPTNSKTLPFNFIECTDGDGNNYPIVQIGNQIWMAENLKTTKYNDGTTIPNVTDYNVWSLTTNNQNLSASFQPLISGGSGSLTLTQLQGAGFINATQKGQIEQALIKIGLTLSQIGSMSLIQINDSLLINAYCWYDNDLNNKNTYGALYNWYAVNTGKLAPVGWHVSSDGEWTTLSNYLGGNSVSGGKLKETGTFHWSNENSGATNETGFTALPGGQRNDQGTNGFIGRDADWWTSTTNSPIEAWSRNITYLGGSTGVYSVDKRSGYSVRCILGTSSLPAVTTTSVSDITNTSATIVVNVTSDGGSDITASGVCWNTSQNPTISNSKITGNGIGAFINIINGLNAGTTYYVRAYATNSAGTAYGEELTFKTSSLPVVTTIATTNIGQTTAISGGNIINDGGATIMKRGVCWSTTQTPTTDNSKTSDGPGAGSFITSLVGLTAGTTYYVRAYATNNAGTAYGNQESFTTSGGGGNCITGTFTDARDGHVYKTITLGTQIWMAENLAYLPHTTPTNKFSSGEPCYYVYDYNKYGVLYNYPAALTASPVGWHLPSDAEWATLMRYLGNDPGSNNSICFSALPGGCYQVPYYSGGFYFTGNNGGWWSSTEYGADYVYYRNLYGDLYGGNTWLGRSVDFRNCGYSVRCIKN